MPRFITAVAASMLTASAALAQPFLEEDFDPAPMPQLTIVPFTDIFNDPEATAAIAPAGNPGNAAVVTADLTMGQSVVQVVLRFDNPLVQWDTAVRGEITSIDLTFDLSGQPPASGAPFQSDLVYVLQIFDPEDEGTLYSTPLQSVTVGPAWRTLSLTDLSAASFADPEPPDLATGRWGFALVAAAPAPDGSPAAWGATYLFDNIAISINSISGPIPVMHTPSRAPDDILYARAPIEQIRIAFDQPVDFTAADVTLTSATSGPIAGATFSGVGTNVMQIDLPAGAAIENDAVTVTLGTGVTGVNGGFPIDGDGDGTAGDPHTFTLRHLCLANVDDNGATDVFDLLAYLDAWFEGCP